MKKIHTKLIIWIIVTSVFALGFLYASFARTRIHDIHAVPLTVSSSLNSDTYITSTDADYNWFQDTMMFSIEIHPGNSNINFISDWTFINDKKLVTMDSISSTSSIITATIPRSELHKGTWNVYVTLNSNGNTDLTNSNTTEHGIPVFTFICN